MDGAPDSSKSSSGGTSLCRSNSGNFPNTILDRLLQDKGRLQACALGVFHRHPFAHTYIYIYIRLDGV